jgi:plastocyanin
MWMVARLFGLPALLAVSGAVLPLQGQSTAGQITGKISFKGTPPRVARIAMDQDPICASLHTEQAYVLNNSAPLESPSSGVHAEDGAVNSDGTLPNVFVYVKSGLQQTYSAPNKPVVLDQRGCMYVPHVFGIMVGQELRVTSTDPTTHNVHVTPKENKEWNESQIPGAAPLVKRFTKPEIMVPVKCNQHPWMKAYIGVTTNPFYAVTGKTGEFTIKGIPPGNYVLEAWTATFGRQEQTVAVSASGSATADFTFSPPQ